MTLGGEFGAEPFDQGGLASAHLAGDDNEAFALRQAVEQMRIGATVGCAGEEQPHIRRHPEGLLVELIYVEIMTLPQKVRRKPARMTPCV